MSIYIIVIFNKLMFQNNLSLTNAQLHVLSLFNDHVEMKKNVMLLVMHLDDNNRLASYVFGNLS